MRTVKISVIGRPAPKGSPRVVTRGRGGVPLKAPRVLKDGPKTEAWHKLVALAARDSMARPGMAPFAQSPLEANVIFYFARPNGHYGKRGLRPSAPNWPAVKPDLDKLVRATMDPLEGVVFDQDSRIVKITAVKLYAPVDLPESAIIWIGIYPS